MLGRGAAVERNLAVGQFEFKKWLPLLLRNHAVTHTHTQRKFTSREGPSRVWATTLVAAGSRYIVGSREAVAGSSSPASAMRGLASNAQMP